MKLCPSKFFISFLFALFVYGILLLFSLCTVMCHIPRTTNILEYFSFVFCSSVAIFTQFFFLLLSFSTIYIFFFSNVSGNLNKLGIGKIYSCVVKMLWTWIKQQKFKYVRYEKIEKKMLLFIVIFQSFFIIYFVFHLIHSFRQMFRSSHSLSHLTTMCWQFII